MRSALLSRHALTPYLYTQARAAYDTGLSICRPLYWHYPEDEEAYQNPQEYLFGADILVAPITEPAGENGLCAQKVWLPEGKWFDPVQGSLLEGNQILQQYYTLDEIPVFVRAGAILPLLPADSKVGDSISSLILDVYPGADGQAELYEDDGATDAYQRGEFTVTGFSQQRMFDRLRVNISSSQGNHAYLPAEKSYQINCLHSFVPSQVLVNGIVLPFAVESKAGYWSYDAARLCVSIRLQPISVELPIVCELLYPDGIQVFDVFLDKVSGVMQRFPAVLQIMKNEVNRIDPLANIPEPLQSYGSFASRLSYHPETALLELSAFRDGYRELLSCIANYDGGDQVLLEKAISLLSHQKMLYSKPQITLSTAASDSCTLVTISSPEPEATIRFTLDGSQPTEASNIYDKPFSLTQMAVICARAFAPARKSALPTTLPDLLPSFASRAVFHLNWAKSVSYAHPQHPKYSGSGALALVDGTYGVKYDYLRDWVGFEAEDAVITIEFARPLTVSAISTRYLRDQSVWIFLPTRVKYELSSDGISFHSAFETDLKTASTSRNNEADILTISAKLPTATPARFLRITAQNVAACPIWHPGAGGKAWVFMDEVIVNGR
jgi:hypothetical protein